PGKLRYRLCQFLQPAVVREPAVVNRWIRTENEFELIRSKRFRPGQIGRIELGGNGKWGKSRACYRAVIQCLSPVLFDISAAQNRLHVLPHSVKRSYTGLVRECRQNFERRVRLI